MYGRGRGRPRTRNASEDSALRALDRLSDINGICVSAAVASTGTHLPQRGPLKAAWLRSRKFQIRADDAELSKQAALDSMQTDMAFMAELAGVHVNHHVKQIKHAGKQTRPHGKTWHPAQILRAAFTPVSTGAFASVLCCGKGSAQDSRALVASAVLEQQQLSIQKLWPPDAVAAQWAIFSKAHDSTKLAMTLPADRLFP